MTLTRASRVADTTRPYPYPTPPPPPLTRLAETGEMPFGPHAAPHNALCRCSYDMSLATC